MELQDRVDDKMWLVKHLERTRQRILDDLIVVKVCSVNKLSFTVNGLNPGARFSKNPITFRARKLF